MNRCRLPKASIRMRTTSTVCFRCPTPEPSCIAEEGDPSWRSCGSTSTVIPQARSVNPATMRIRPYRRMGPASRLPSARPALGDLWIVDVARGTNTRFTFDAANDDNPVWSPDGKAIAFASNRQGSPKPYVKPADGLGEERLLADTTGVPTSWSNDGRFLLLTVGSPETLNDIWVVRVPDQASNESKPTSLLASRFNEAQARFSPDGRWVAYTSNESSAIAVYVQPFSPAGSAGTGGAKWLISKGLGAYPRWSSDGKQLFYINAQSLDLMAVDIDTSKGFQAGTPRRLLRRHRPLSQLGGTTCRTTSATYS